MTTFFCLPAYDFNNQEQQFTIATCPVVVNSAGDKILLHIGTSTGKWQYIGGRYSDDVTFRENAILHGKKELGENNELTLVDPENPTVLFDEIDLHWYEEKTLLIHYRAKIADENNIAESRWFTLDEIEILDAKFQTSSPNVRIIAEKFLKKS